MSRKLLWAFAVAGLLCAALLRAARVNVPDGTPIPVRLRAELSSSRAQVGDRVDFAVAHAVQVGGVVVIPEGCVAWGAVQSVKRDKEIRFDVQGLRLPNLREIKLRVSRQKTSNPGKDLIKLETQFGDTVGAAPGTEFTAYVNEDVEVDGAEPATPAAGAAAPATSHPAEVKPATPRPAVVALAPPSQALRPAPPAATTVSEPGAEAERVTVECYSDPTGAEIVINDEYYGNTPSILKLLPVRHRMDFKLPGYKTFSQTLDLTEGGAFRTVRGSLEKKE